MNIWLDQIDATSWLSELLIKSTKWKRDANWNRNLTRNASSNKSGTTFEHTWNTNQAWSDKAGWLAFFMRSFAIVITS